MFVFASEAWVTELQRCLTTVVPAGRAAPLRVRYRFVDHAGAGCGYDLWLRPGHAVAAEHIAEPATVTSPMNSPADVVITQRLALAAEVAAGRESAQRALLRGDITVTGDVTALLGWAPALDQIEIAMGPLRALTDWSAAIRSA